jgi:peroxidase
MILFEESRRIVGAQFQHIVYHEYLPKLIGAQLMDRYELVPNQSGYYKGIFWCVGVVHLQVFRL